jgi:hypothetical protein
MGEQGEALARRRRIGTGSELPIGQYRPGLPLGSSARPAPPSSAPTPRRTPPDAHGWFLGYQLGGPQGDLAFAVLVGTGRSSSVAVDVTDAFLGGLG